MRRRRLFSIVLVFLLALIGLGLWWFLRPTIADEAKTAAAPTLAKIDSIKIVAPPAQVELPKAPVVPAHADAAADVAAAAPPSADPQSDLKTLMPDIARSIRAGNLLDFYQTFHAPDKIDPQHIKQLRAQQAMDAKMAVEYPAGLLSGEKIAETVAESYEALENQIPIYNAAGDEATYQITLPADSDMQLGIFSGAGKQMPMTFVKINGRWYIEPVTN